jgi:hypothetical protein
MANNIAFQVMGNTFRLNLTTTSAEVAVNAFTPCNQVRVHNGTAAEVAIRFSATTGAAAVFPVSGTPSASTVLPSNQTAVFTVPQASISAQSTLYVSAILGSGTGYLYVTPGEGLA